MPAQGPGRYPVIAAALLVLAAGLWAYHTSFDGAFVFDDKVTIVDNPVIDRPWFASDGGVPRRIQVRMAMRPVLYLTLAANHAAGGLHVWGYHAVNLAIHLLAALVLFGIVRRTLLTERLRARYGESSTWLALAASLIWVVHPLQTQSVTYIIQRAESLMGLWYLLTLYCAIRGLGAARPGGWHAASIACCALGMGTKAIMVTAPLLVLLYDRTFLSASFRDALRLHRGLYLGLAATWGVLAALLAPAPSLFVGKIGFAMQDVKPLDYALTQPGVILHYLRLACWPHPLVLDYDWPVADTARAIAPPALAIGALIGMTVWAIRRRLAVGFLGAWFFVILAPTSGVYPIVDMIFEHRMYLPLAAVVVLAVFGGWSVVCRLAPPGRVRIGAAACSVAALVMLFGTMTIRRNADYHSETGMWEDVVAKQPGNPRPHDNLGYLLAHEGRIAEAVEHFQQAVRLKPSAPEYHVNLGNALLQQGKADEAIARYAEAIRLDPQSPVAYSNWANALEQQGKGGEALEWRRNALRLQPEIPDLHNQLAFALAEQGQFEEAITHFTDALRIRPDLENARENLVLAHNGFGAALFKEGRLDEAVEQFTEALRLDPHHATARNNLAAVLTQQGKMSPEQYRQAVEPAP